MCHFSLWYLKSESHEVGKVKCAAILDCKSGGVVCHCFIPILANIFYPFPVFTSIMRVI